MQLRDDREFLDRLERADQQCVAEVATLLRPLLFRVVRSSFPRRLKRRMDPEDIVQLALSAFHLRLIEGAYHLASAAGALHQRHHRYHRLPRIQPRAGYHGQIAISVLLIRKRKLTLNFARWQIEDESGERRTARRRARKRRRAHVLIRIKVVLALIQCRVRALGMGSRPPDALHRALSESPR